MFILVDIASGLQPALAARSIYPRTQNINSAKAQQVATIAYSCTSMLRTAVSNLPPSSYDTRKTPFIVIITRNRTIGLLLLSSLIPTICSVKFEVTNDDTHTRTIITTASFIMLVCMRLLSNYFMNEDMRIDLCPLIPVRVRSS